MLSLLGTVLLANPVLAAPGNGFGSARLVGGNPDFSECIEGGGDCQTDFFSFLTEAMVEQGFAMQDHALATSPLTHRRKGWNIGGSLATFPFGPPPENLSGKEENTQFSPVFPRITGGYIAGDDGKQRAIGLSFTPPIPVNGASALGLGLNGALGRGGREATRQVLEADLSFVRANAPIAATEAQFEDRESLGYSSNLDPQKFEASCGEDIDNGAGGCVDTFTMLNLSVRAGQSWSVGNGFSPYVKAGVTVVDEWLYIKYDDTTWGVFAIQPTLHAGSSWNAGEHLFLALGASAALRQANQSEAASIGLFSTFEGAVAWAF
jgi:opacity protein-like surface antigen